MYDAGNRAHIKAAERAARFAERQRGEIIAGLMSTQAGRAYIHDRLVASHVFATSFSTDSLQMAFNEGERNQGLQILTDVMRWAPAAYVQMMMESNARDSARDAERDAAGADGNGRDQGSVPSDADRDDEGNTAFEGYNGR